MPPSDSRNFCAHELLHRATHHLRLENRASPVTPTSPGCAYCQRPWETVEDAGVAYGYQYTPQMATEFLCSSCYTPRIAAEQALGVERLAGKGTPVFGKLGMLPGSGGIITPEGVLHLALPKGFITKYRDGHYGRQGQLHEIGSGVRPLNILLSLMDTTPFNLGRGFLYIESWGRKPDVLLQELRLSYSLSELWCNSEKGVVVRDVKAHLATARELCRQGLEAQGIKPSFWASVRRAAQGHSLVSLATSMDKWLSKVPEPQALLATLPVDPHERLELPSMMKALVPLVIANPRFLENAT